MKKIENSNIFVIFFIIIIAITSGIIGWALAKRTQPAAEQWAIERPAERNIADRTLDQNKINDSSIKKPILAEAQEVSDGIWADTEDKYIKIDPGYQANTADVCVVGDKSIKGGTVVTLLKSEDKTVWAKAVSWSGDNYDLYRFKDCGGKVGLVLEVSKDEGKTWIRDYDGAWMAYDKRDGAGNTEFCKFSLGTSNSLWVEAACAK